MSQNIKFEKSVLNKNQYTKTIDTAIRQLGVKTIQEQIEEQPDIDAFFRLYKELFYDIPSEGEFNSHEFLIKKSTEYINFDEPNEEIIALQNEIAQLRQELLEEQKKNIDLQLGN